MSTYTISTIEELAAIATLEVDGDGGYVYVITSPTDLQITESLDIPGLSLYAGSLSCDKSLTVRGDMYINNGSVSVTGDFKARYVVIGESLSVNGDIEITEDLYPYGSVSVGGNMSCGYFNNQDDPISVGGDLLMQGGFYGGPTSVGGNIASPEDVVLRGPLTVGKSINVGGWLGSSPGGIIAGNNINVGLYIVCDGPITAG